MTIQIEIPDPLATKLTAAAKSQGKTPEAVVMDALYRTLEPPTEPDVVLAPVRRAFLQSGMTEDEAVEEFEREKHSMRRERRESKAG